MFNCNSCRDGHVSWSTTFKSAYFLEKALKSTPVRPNMSVSTSSLPPFLEMSGSLVKIQTLVQAFRGISLPRSVRIVEVGPRDGLQNEAKVLPTDLKVEFIDRLSNCGFRNIETTSFVSPKWVPQMGDGSEVFRRIQKREGTTYVALTPNLKGYLSAQAVGVREVAVFAAASESFSRSNINCSIEESLERFRPIMTQAYRDKVRVRGYVSCVLGCPYEGQVDPFKVRTVAKRMKDMGCYEISLGDTIGAGTPEATRAMLEEVMREIPAEQLAMHFHDTGGRALDNILVGLSMGVTVLDASVASLGGCPYAKGATGNVSTEDVVYMLGKLGVETAVDLPALCEVASWISASLQRENRSRYQGSET